MPKDEEERYKLIRQVGILTTIPMVLAACPILGYFIGNYLDKRFNTDPWFTFGFIIIGFIAGAKETIDLIKRADREGKEKKGNGH